MKTNDDVLKLLPISDDIETEYLNKYENTKAHFIGQIDNNLFSEITIGETLAQTKQICFGYYDNSFCTKLLDIANKETMNLDFWYAIA